MRILGLDEAGRGCVLGPLVVGGFLTTARDLNRVRQTGATDSKKLSAKRREKLVPLLENIGEAHLVNISPRQIDNGNLNTLEEEAFAALF